MLFTSENNDIFGMVTLHYGNGGSATLNNNQIDFAENSTGTIGYRLGSWGANTTLEGTGNTVNNAVEDTLFDTDTTAFDGTIEVNGNDVP